MVKITISKWEELDVGVLADLSSKVRKIECLGDYTSEQLEEHLRFMNEKYPIEVAALALEENKILGWMAIERTTKDIGEVKRWQPFVMAAENKERIARLLISSIVDYADSNGMTRVEVGFGGISNDNLNTFDTKRTWYEAEGWNKLEDIIFMRVNPIESEQCEMQPPEGFELQPLNNFDNNRIFECYHDAFTTGEARWIYEMTKEQRRQEYEKNFDRARQINNDASFAIISDGSIVGFILVISRTNDEEHLESIGVNPNYRGMSVGKTLLGKSIEVLRTQGAQNFTLGVDPINIPAVNLYERFGFKVVSMTTRYFWKANAH